MQYKEYCIAFYGIVLLYGTIKQLQLNDTIIGQKTGERERVDVSYVHSTLSWFLLES